MGRIKYSELKSGNKLWWVAAILIIIMAIGAFAVFKIEHYGHIVTGMNNQIVWGVPHIFAIFLILSASGALNIASISSVFGKQEYKPLARLSSLIAISLLIGGLSILVLDLGRVDRLIIAMTTYNFKSIFAWNVLLYTGFLGVVAIYLYAQMVRKEQPFLLKSAALIAFLWRLVLTTGTGSIFGWLVARSAYDAAIMAPMFIAMSFSFGLAVFMLIFWGISALGDGQYTAQMRMRQSRLLAIFVAVVLYFTLISHLTNLYLAEHGEYERFILLEGGIYSLLFWVGHIFIGSIIPLILLLCPKLNVRNGAVLLATILVILGGFAQLYVIIIGGQAYPLEIFPGYEVSSSFSDGIINKYMPSHLEFMLGMGGIALALLIILLSMKILRILPVNLSKNLEYENKLDV